MSYHQNLPPFSRRTMSYHDSVELVDDELSFPLEIPHRWITGFCAQTVQRRMGALAVERIFDGSNEKIDSNFTYTDNFRYSSLNVSYRSVSLGALGEEPNRMAQGPIATGISLRPPLIHIERSHSLVNLCEADDKPDSAGYVARPAEPENLDTTGQCEKEHKPPYKLAKAQHIFVEPCLPRPLNLGVQTTQPDMPLLLGMFKPYSFYVPRRYKMREYISEGSQGVVATAYDEVTKKEVAVKMFKTVIGSAHETHRAFREFLCLSRLQHPYIVKFFSAFSPNPDFHSFREFYVVMEYRKRSKDLFSALKERERTKEIFSHRRISLILYQLISAVFYLHEANVVHRDLKPGNLLYDDDENLRVLDFGLSRVLFQETPLTHRTCTQFYRAPELILELEYGTHVDMWSIGVIFMEIVNHVNYFRGNNTHDQWRVISDKLGPASENMKRKITVQALRDVVERYSGPWAYPMTSLMPAEKFDPSTEIPSLGLTAEYAQDLASKLLKIDPDDRITAREALKHPYLSAWFTGEEMQIPLARLYSYRFEKEGAFWNPHIWRRRFFRAITFYMEANDVFTMSF